jgi:O-antigen/teichoic acid export membrane protein
MAPARLIGYARRNSRYLTGAFAAAGGRIAVSALVAHGVPPTEYGRWALLETVLLYAPLLGGGIINGLRRELPHAADQEEGTRFLGAALYLGLFLTLLGSSAVLLAVAGGLSTLALATLLAAFTQHSQQVLFGMHRARLHFEQVGSWQAAGALASTVFAGLLTTRLGVLTLPLALSAGHLCAIGLGVMAPDAPRPAWPLTSDCRRLIRVGLPIAASGLLFTFWITLDRWMVGRTLGLPALGTYFPALLTSTVLGFARTLVSERYYPEIVHAHVRGLDGRSAAAVARVENLATMALVAPLAVTGIVLMPFLVPKLFPAYEAGVPAAQLVACGHLVLAMSAGAGDFLNATGQARRYLVAQAGALLASFAIWVIAPQLVTGLTGMGAVALITFGIQSAAVLLARGRTTNGAA